MNCPRCNSSEIIKNGILSSGSQSYRCKSCGKQFVENPLKSAVKEETIQLIDTLLLGRLSLVGIVRVTGVSESWLQSYVVTIQHLFAAELFSQAGQQLKNVTLKT